jgi:hypothetical protein
MAVVSAFLLAFDNSWLLPGGNFDQEVPVF